MLTTATGYAQKGTYDSTAIYLLDRMTDVIGDLQSCSVVIHTAIDEEDLSYGPVRHYGIAELSLSGPDKMLVTTRNDKGHRQYMFNGKQLAYYSFNENNYGIVPAPLTTVELIDQFHQLYGIDFPGGDFFYPTFTDDLMASFPEIRFVGRTVLDGKECFHLLARNKEMVAQFWIANDALTLPVKMLIVESANDHKQYEATYSQWVINPVLPSAMFDFLPPSGANRLRIVAKNEK